MTAHILSAPEAPLVHHGDHAEEHSDNAVFGFWVYLMTDCILFACLFATYAVLRHTYAGGPTGKELFDLRYVFIETMALLLSSFANGFAMLSLYRRERATAVLWLIVTAALGL